MMIMQYGHSYGGRNPGRSSPNLQNIPRGSWKQRNKFVPGMHYRIAGGVASFIGWNRADPRFGFFNFGGKTNNMLSLSALPCNPVSALEMLGRQADTGDE